jgi:HPt (histidine-containing phosphotransfer) domain-containing protein
METLKHLEELGSSPKFIEKLVGVFLSDNGALLERVEKALASRNFGEFRAVVHAMKGSSASIGTDRLTRLCTSFGALSDAEVRLRAPALLRSLGDEMHAARDLLDRYLEEKRQSAG